jgi:hypothetical protein
MSRIKCNRCGGEGDSHGAVICCMKCMNKLIDALTIIANSDESDLGEYAKLVEDVARRALNDSKE